MNPFGGATAGAGLGWIPPPVSAPRAPQPELPREWRARHEGKGASEPGQEEAQGARAFDYAQWDAREKARNTNRWRYKMPIGPRLAQPDPTICEACRHEFLTSEYRDGIVYRRATCLVPHCKARLCTEMSETGRLRFVKACYVPHMKGHTAQENSQARSDMVVFLENMDSLRIGDGRDRGPQ